MHWIDWVILVGTLTAITAYGSLKTRNAADMKTYLVGNRELKWWTVGLSIMATQASAITFLSTTGQGFESGMGFAQFYFGLPIAMVILSIFFLPIFYKLKVFTAYEYLEQRFDDRVRMFTAFLFLASRSMGAGLTIYAPAIVLSSILGWDLWFTTIMLGTFVIVYTVVGGSEAVSVTQQQQMTVILSGLVVALLIMISKLPQQVGFGDALHIAGKLGKTKIVDFNFDWNNRYNFWTGMLGGTFLFLSYFGTDQSQVQRYLGGKSLVESRLGLMFNGIFKVPMQFLVLLVGVMMFVFYQFNLSPIHFNGDNLSKLRATPQYQDSLKQMEARHQTIFEQKRNEVTNLVEAVRNNNENATQSQIEKIQALQQQEKKIREEVKNAIKKVDTTANKDDRDYVFITFVMQNLPIGIVGLLLAVIFSAAMSSKSSELNALATTTLIDFYKRKFVTDATDSHYMKMSKIFTAFWGVFSLAFALLASTGENLIQAVNFVGSVFYGVILGVFVTAFFFKNVQAKAMLWSAVCLQIIIAYYSFAYGWGNPKFPYLWLNLFGCTAVVFFGNVLQWFFRTYRIKENI
jgi:Na+/proline symporter